MPVIRRHLSICLVAALIAVSATGMDANMVLASKCNPNRSDVVNWWFVQRIQDLGGVMGVRSNIYTYSPWVVFGGFSYAWTMLTHNGVDFEWVQIGNYEAVSDDRHVLVQFSDGSTAHNVNFQAKAIGSTNTHTVTYDPTTLTFSAKVNGIVKWQGALAWVPNRAEVSAEIWHRASQMMGDKVDHERFSTNQIEDQWALWSAFTGTLSWYDQSLFGQSGTASSFDTWDTACPP